MLIIEFVAREAAIIESEAGTGREGKVGGLLPSSLSLLSVRSGRERLILAAGLVKHGEVVTRNPYGRRH